MAAEWKRTLVELYRALHAADDRPSMTRAIALTRLAGHQFRNQEARLILAPVVAELEGSRAPGAMPGADTIRKTGSGPGAPLSVLPSDSPPHSVANSPSVGSPQERRRRGTLRAVGDDTSEAARERDKNDDFYSRLAKRTGERR